MNEEKWLFIGSDKRLPICSELMAKRGYTCQSIETNSYTPGLEKLLNVYKPNHIVFPIMQLNGTIPIKYLGETTNIYTGLSSESWLQSFKDAKIKLNCYLDEEQFVWKNARLTAEAFIAVYYEKMSRRISTTSFTVAGYGRVGKMIADVLGALGGDVTILVRSEVDLGEAESRGFKTTRIDSDLNLSNTCLINTIPAKWLSLQKTKDLYIFDLASAPGCLVEGLMPEYYILLPGLPGRHFPVDAATALADALERIYRR